MSINQISSQKPCIKAVIYGSSATNERVSIVLTKDHNPTVYEERLRIQKSSGSVRDGRVLGVLEVSRSIGDGQFKTYGFNIFYKKKL